MTIEEITAELPKLDAGTLASVRLAINTGKLYRSELQAAHKAGLTWKAIEDELTKIIDENYQTAKPDHFAVSTAQWKLAILAQLKGARPRERV